MRLQTVVLLAGAAIPVLASERAAGWEAGLYYNVYKMDGYRPAGDQTIATGCKGTNGKRCNFLQFIDYIAQPNKIGKKSYPVINEANVPSTFDRENPCPSCAAEVIDWKGQEDPRHIAKPDMFKEKYLPGYGGTYDQRALLGSRYTGGMKHGDVLEKIGAAAQDARSAAGDAGKNILKDINISIDNVQLGRVEDNAESLRRDLLNKPKLGLEEWKDKVGEIPTKQVTVEGTDLKYTAIDSDKFMENIDNNSAFDDNTKKAIKDRINTYVTDYTNRAELSEKEGSSGVTHHRDILAVQKISGILKADLPASC